MTAKDTCLLGVGGQDDIPWQSYVQAAESVVSFYGKKIDCFP